MAVSLTSFNILIPVAVLEDRWGKEKTNRFLREQGNRRDLNVCCDGSLYQEAVNSIPTRRARLHFWRKQGLQFTEQTATGPKWKDLCTVSELMGTSYRCDWLTVDLVRGEAKLKETSALKSKTLDLFGQQLRLDGGEFFYRAC